MAKPVKLTDDFIRAGLSKGWLTPPRDGPGKSPVRRLVEYGLVIVACVLLCTAGVLYGLFAR